MMQALPHVLWMGLSCALAAVQDGSGSGPSQNVPQANPGRPTVSTPATLTPVGYLQFENGGLYASGSPDAEKRFGVTQVTKLAVTKRVQVLTLFEPLVSASEVNVPEDRAGSRPGEFFLGGQAVLLPGTDRRPTLSASYIRRVYESPAPEVDYGTFSNSVVLLLSGDVKGLHVDLNGMVNEQSDVRVRRAQFGQTLSVSHAFGKATASVELWHFSQPLTRGNAVGNLYALSYAVRPNLVLDAGLQRGLTSTSTPWEGFFGFTYLLPKRLWKHSGNGRVGRAALPQQAIREAGL